MSPDKNPYDTFRIGSPLDKRNPNSNNGISRSVARPVGDAFFLRVWSSLIIFKRIQLPCFTDGQVHQTTLLLGDFIITRANSFDEGRTESLVLHFIKTNNGAAFRRSHLVNLFLGMAIEFKQ
jgi:hypothetical protein